MPTAANAGSQTFLIRVPGMDRAAEEDRRHLQVGKSAKSSAKEIDATLEWTKKLV
jgi:hypothetical protein